MSNTAARLLNFINAASYLLNPHNFEAGWGPVLEDALREALDGRTRAADIYAQLDINLDAATRKLVGPDKSLTLDPLSFRSCRPDASVGYFALTKRPDKKLRVHHLAVPVLVEMKRAPSRTKVNLATGHPRQRKGRTAIRSQLRKAQKQVVSQGALFLRTPAGQKQRRVLLIACAGRHYAYTVMSVDDAAYQALDPAQMVQFCVDVQSKEEEAMWASMFAKEAPEKEEQTPLPKPDKVLGYDWTGCGDATVDEELAVVVREHLDGFEATFKEQYPATFDDIFFDT